MNTDLQTYKNILQQYWGYTDFRDLQDKIVLSVAAGQDTLGLMPTGGGKSITFQVPAMAMKGVCIVVTPLIALMKDQVQNLRSRHIKATAIYSGMTRDEIIIALENCILGGYKFLYVSPERLATEIFLTKLKQMTVSFLVVDEAHCISQWGYDFRPPYLRIAEIRKLLPENTPVLALTATATPEVVNDIQAKLQFRKKNVFQKSFERKNLAYVVKTVDDKPRFLLNVLNGVPGSAIVYVRDRQKTKEIAQFLVQNEMTADFFHAGLSNEAKDRKQEAWKKGACRVMVATNAFGMGIDKPDVRLVVHIDLPDSLEAYFQEAGRAGRDEQKAYAVLLFSKADSAKLKKRIFDSFPEKDRIRRTYEALGNYFQVAEGYGLDAVYDFSLASFCSVFRFPILPTYSALKILQNAGYIELTEEQDNASRLIFTVHRDELYKIRLNNPAFDNIINLVLRLYTGLFTDFSRIDEGEIALRLKMPRQEVYESLKELSKRGIVKYIPAKKTPFIVFTQERQDHEKISIGKEVYEKRKERFEKRIASVLEYAESENICRNKMLLAYFGEKNACDCGVCDVCLKSKRETLKNNEFLTIRETVKNILQKQPLNIQQLVDTLKFEEEKSLSAIRFMIDNEVLVYDEDMNLSLP
ncbi:MAG: RecQ family ATP-dependent DNA helicase [Prevotellaceae bacterium]|jgi:ATP-dependent DNA helicase RecQ|nr:RecQ family ATP-dependent DNA helicase [Prevotellaceae bacterium]